MREERREEQREEERRKEKRREEGREVDYAAACCHALCCLVLQTKNLMFKAFDLPQQFHVFLLLVVASSAFADFKPSMMCGRDVA